ncbi:MAG: hypothetical protein KGD73_12200 [Candidatus Lokiarchaeota archaeon]|nr:hypothetical protein [Candidatus Lokiarchaeota archaeon]
MHSYFALLPLKIFRPLIRSRWGERIAFPILWGKISQKIGITVALIQ